MDEGIQMIITEKAKVKGNNHNNPDIFHFFLEYQQANEQRVEEEQQLKTSSSMIEYQDISI